MSVNKQFLLGKLGKDAEIKTAKNGKELAIFSLATNYNYKNAQNEWEEETTWHKIVDFNISDYKRNNLVKGATVHVEGRTVHESYEDKNGVTKTSTKVIADRVEIV